MLLDDRDSGAAHHRAEPNCDFHRAGKVRIVEAIVVADALARSEFDIRAAEGVGLPGAEVRERHSTASADTCVDRVYLADESMWRKCFGSEDEQNGPVRGGATTQYSQRYERVAPTKKSAILLVRSPNDFRHGQIARGSRNAR